MPLARSITFTRSDGTRVKYAKGAEPLAIDLPYLTNPEAWVGGVAPYAAPGDLPAIVGRDGLWVPEGWGQHFERRQDVVIFGDSVAEGWSATDLRNGYWQQVADAVKVGRGDGGSGWIGVDIEQASMQGFLPGAVTGVTKTGSWTVFANTGMGGTSLVSATPDSTIVFTNVVGTTLDVFWERNTTLGTIDIIVDGVVKADDLATVGARAQMRTTIAGLTAGPHTVTIKNNQVAGCSIQGICGRNATGVRFHNYAKSGATTAFPQSAIWAAVSKQSLTIGAQQGSADVGLLALCFGINDANADVSEATYEDNLNATIRDLQYYWGYLPNKEIDLLFVLHPFTNSAAAGFSRYRRYVGAVHRLARAYGGAVYDANARLNGRAERLVAEGLAVVGDPTHPTTPGHSWIAGPLSRLLTR